MKSRTATSTFNRIALLTGVLLLFFCLAPTVQAAEVEWGLIDVVSSDQNDPADSALDTAWSTTTCAQPQFGRPGNNYPVKSAFSAYDSDRAGADYNAELYVSNGSPDMLPPRGRPGWTCHLAQ